MKLYSLTERLTGRLPVTPAIFLLLIFCRSVNAAASPESADSVTVLDEIIVNPNSLNPVRTVDSKTTSLDVAAMGRMLRTFGEADPLNYLKMLGGVTSSSDYSSGLSVQGSAYSHSVFTVGKATVFFPYHFGGIFSTFNSAHFPRVEISKGNFNASYASRLGATIRLKSRNYHPAETHASANIGMTASSVDLRLPLSSCFSIEISGRLSYLDRLYGPLLEMGDQKINYSFGETAFSALWTPSQNDRLKLDFVFNSDRLNLTDRHYSLETYLKWRNTAASLVWTREGTVPLSVWATISNFKNTLAAEMPALSIDVPSYIAEAKAGGEIRLATSSDRSYLIVGTEISGYRARPQAVSSSDKAREAGEIRIYATAGHRIDNHFTFDIGAKASLYHTPGYRSSFLSPVVNLDFSDDTYKAGVHFSVSPQYLHQTGLADIGLSSNFWYPSSSASPRELASSVSLTGSRLLLDDRLEIAIEPYYKRIINEPEYNGILLDFIEQDYKLDDHLIHADGFNAGVDIRSTLTAGKLAAMANYSLGYARRRFPTDSGRYLPAMAEGLHSFNTMWSYSLTPQWSFSANFTLSSGRCYTPVKALYMLGENVMMVLGPRNSARMPLYHRLDLSGAYSFRSKGHFPLKHTIVLSLINAYGHRNIELSTYRFSAEDKTFYRHDVASLYRFLPSLSYTIEY